MIMESSVHSLLFLNKHTYQLSKNWHKVETTADLLLGADTTLASYPGQNGLGTRL